MSVDVVAEQRAYRLLLLGGTTSIIGTQITAVALPLLLIAGLTTSAMALSLVAAARYVPFIVLSVPVGAVVDRRDPLLVMLLADASRLVLMALIPVLSFAGLLSVPMVLLLVLATATGRVFFDLSSAKLVVTRFHRSSWLRVNSGLDTAANVGELVGPPAAGGLTAVVGAAWALVLDSASYVVSLLTVLALRRDEPAPRPAAEVAADAPPGRASTRVAFRLLWDTVPLRYLILGSSLQNFALMTAQGVALLYLVDGKGLGSAAAGLVIAALGVGSVVGAARAPWLVGRLGLLRSVALAGPVTALGPLALLAGGPAWVRLTVAMAGYALLGASIAATSVAGRRYRQEVVPADVYGRVSGLVTTVLMGTLPLGAVTGGVVGSAAGLPAVMVVSAAVFTVAAGTLVAAQRTG